MEKPRQRKFAGALPHPDEELSEKLSMQKLRYYVQRDGERWIIIDSRKLRLQNDIAAVCATRKEARIKVKKMNDLEKVS